MPFETVIALGATPFMKPAGGWDTPYGGIQKGDIGFVMRAYLAGLTGIHVDGNGAVSFDAGQVLNPFNFNDANYLKMIVGASLIGMVRKRLLRNSSAFLKKIPLLGRFVS